MGKRFAAIISVATYRLNRLLLIVIELLGMLHVEVVRMRGFKSH